MNFSGFGKGNARAVLIDGTEVPVEMRRNARARRMILRLDKTSSAVTVTLPEQCSEAQGLRFARDHAGWIAKRLEERPAAVPFANGVAIPVRGEQHVITHRPETRGTVWIEDGAGEARRLCVAGDTAYLPRRVKDWLKREARGEIKARCAHYADAMGLAYRRVDIRDQTSRWGSCSSSGILSFSWRLILAPVHVLDYVAAHEVAHLQEMNHGPKFWALVEAALPTMKQSRQWLKRHGSGLHLYGAGR